ncbi:MAG: WG repeat-containing protein [Deltaproteobacteria bacterium]|nr:WG repeat-containing protein [Deltaproteobacteria bacterium]
MVEGGTWGYIDNKGDWVISPIFGFAGQFEEGKARVKLNGRCEFINKSGKIISDCKEEREQERLKENGKVMY